MHHLIINCDDFGLSQEINSGIYNAYHAGVLSSATLLVNGHARKHAEDIIANCPNLDVGLHINLDEYFDFGTNGYYGHSISNVNPSKIEELPQHLAEIEEKIEAQIKLFHSFNIKMSHIDGHHHVHLIPGIFNKVVKLAKKYSIKRMRYFREFYDQNTVLCEEHEAILKSSLILYPEDFQDFSNLNWMSNVTAKTTEVMVHISSLQDHTDWRSRQLHRLLSESTIQSKGVKISSWGIL